MQRADNMKLVLNTRDDRPKWAMPETVPDAIARALGPGWSIENVKAPVSSRGDGGSVSAQAIEAIRGAEIYIGAGVPRELLLAALEPPARLRWAHSTTAGISSFLYPEMLQSQVVLTNSAGVHAAPMAETALAMMLHFARGLDFAIEAQTRGNWDDERFTGAGSPVREIAGARLGIVGLGGIGRELAWRAEALGMQITATRRSSSRADLELLLRESDYIAVCAPDTPETRGLIGAREIALLKADAVLLSLSRGSLIDEPALISALQERRIRGAGLDVFAHEPLAPESPLWRLPNVVITPHVSAVTDRYWERQLALILDNIERYKTGRELRNVVDKTKGY